MKKKKMFGEGSFPLLWCFSLLFAFILSGQSLYANPGSVQQQKIVTGTVVDADQFPLIGVSVSIKGTTIGTITDIDGNYSINVPNAQSTIQFTFVGYISKSMVVGQQAVIDVVLQEDVQNLDEVVVVGYGVQRKSHLTGSISKLRTDGLEDIPVSNVAQALQGRVSGVQIQNTTSEVGSSPVIRVRGLGSLGADSSPLIVVDGFPIADGLSALDMNDIESIEVLKDAASAAIYGSRGANGVIIVTTKSGDIKKPKFSIKASYGFKDAYKLHPIMSSSEYVDMMMQQAPIVKNRVSDAEMSFISINNNTDWQKEALRTGHIYNAQFSVSGGTKEVKYYVSGSYMKDEGIMLQNEYEKINFRAKMDARLSKKVTLGVNLAPTYQKKQKPGPNFINFYRYPSWMPVRHNENTIGIVNPDGSPLGPQIGDYAKVSDFNSKQYSYTYPNRVYVDDNNTPLEYPGLTWVDSSGRVCYPDGVTVSTNGKVNYPTTNNVGELITNPDGTVTRNYVATPWTSADNSPREWMDNETRYQHDYKLQASTYLNFEINKYLTFRTANSVYLAYTDNDWYKDREAQKPNETNVGTYFNKLYSDLLTENTLTYTRTFGKHGLDGVLGFTAQKSNNKLAQLIGTDFPTDKIWTINAAGKITAPYVDANGNYQGSYTLLNEETMASFLGRVNYSYEDKYLASVVMRADGSSNFGPDDRWGYFPSVSLGWRASEEAFLKKYEWMNQLKLRGSWGVTGNKEIPGYVYTSKYESVQYPFGTGSGSLSSGVGNTESYIANKSISWEQTNEYNLGVDMSFLNSRINFTVDFYNAESKKLLLERPVMNITGYKNMYDNVGKVRNRGFEFELSLYPLKTKDFQWNFVGNLATNKNKLLDLGGDSELISSGERQILWIAKVGEPSIQYYGWKTIGVWDTVEEINANPHRVGDVPGGLRLYNADGDAKVDANGVPLIDESDYVALGSPFPDFTWGITNSFKYRDFDFSFLIQGSQGGKICNGDSYYNEVRRYDRNYVSDRWLSPEHRGDGMTPYYQKGVNVWLTDYVLEDASYAVLRNMTLGYTFNKKICKVLGISSLRAYASGENLLWIMADGYRGINPEARYTSSDWASPFIDGYQRGGFPSQRTFSFGLDLVF